MERTSSFIITIFSALIEKIKSALKGYYQRSNQYAFFSIFIFLVSCAFSTSLPAEVLKMGIGDWCPYVCDPNKEDGKEGYLTDMMKVVFAKAGYQIETYLLPFARNIITTRAGKMHGIIAAYRTDVPDFIFPQEPQGQSVNTFYVQSSQTWKFEGIASLKKINKIGLIGGYDYGYGNADFAAYVKSNPAAIDIISGDRPLERNIQKLLAARIDTLLEDNRVAQYNLDKLKVADKIIEVGRLGEPSPVYIVFSPALPAEQSSEYAHILVAGIAQLRSSGELEKILKKYGLNDWQN